MLPEALVTPVSARRGCRHPRANWWRCRHASTQHRRYSLLRVRVKSAVSKGERIVTPSATVSAFVSISDSFSSPGAEVDTETKAVLSTIRMHPRSFEGSKTSVPFRPVIANRRIDMSAIAITIRAATVVPLVIWKCRDLNLWH